MIRHLIHGVLTSSQVAAVGVVGALVDDSYGLVSAEAIDKAAPVVAIAGLCIFLVLGVLEWRELPRGRRGR
jgi:hypothetical protein